jgi:hypothetical protein
VWKLVFSDVVKLLNQAPEMVNHGRPASAIQIEQAEQSLGLLLPPAFKLYLQQWGWLSFGPFEFKGLNSEISDFVRFTLAHRRRGLPSALIPVLDHEGDVLECLDTASSPNVPVVLWDIANSGVMNVRSASFEVWLETTIRDFLES